MALAHCLMKKMRVGKKKMMMMRWWRRVVVGTSSLVTVRPEEVHTEKDEEQMG
uniref:Uncharacterized protein n=1 Tax=Aegilops tauschii TaxID=37682 RepID=M8BSJ9_AEGTA